MSKNWERDRAIEAIVQLRNADMFLRFGVTTLKTANTGEGRAALKKAVEIVDAHRKAKEAIDALYSIANEGVD